ncbi:MAG: hypothetical protein GY917_03830, partial [Planctomycetaceae bacterium]|nr:hypothetical protein [Planctomycetaceae bacterium]
MRSPNLLSAVLLVTCLACALDVPNASAQSETDFFETKIRPLLVTHCLKCHGPEKQESDLRLDAPRHWTKGGLGGPAIIPGKPQSSLLLRAVKKTDPDLQMPPGKKKLSPREIASLEKWIKAGAIAPRQPTTTPLAKLTLKGAASFWSFRPVTRPASPSSRSIDSWSWTPVDRFVHARLDAEGLAPVAV